MSKRTWICVTCRRGYRRKKSLTSVECPKCHAPCEVVHWLNDAPSPKETGSWDKLAASIKERKAIKARMEAADRIKQESEQVKKPARAVKSFERRVPYLEAISRPLIQTVNHAAALPVNQLAGHAANWDFWVSETKHCLAVIDGYQKRFDRLQAGQAAQEKRHEGAGEPRLRRGSKDHRRQELRGALCEAIERFLSRCHRERLISEKAVTASFEVLGIDRA